MSGITALARTGIACFALSGPEALLSQQTVPESPAGFRHNDLPSNLIYVNQIERVQFAKNRRVQAGDKVIAVERGLNFLEYFHLEIEQGVDVLFRLHAKSKG